MKKNGLSKYLQKKKKIYYLQLNEKKIKIFTKI